MSVFTDMIDKAKALPIDKLLPHRESDVSEEIEAVEEDNVEEESVPVFPRRKKEPELPKTRTALRFYTPAGYMEEARFLEDMHLNGWQLVKISAPGIYRFEPCEEREVIYQLDYCENEGRFKDGYFHTFSENGWEYVLTYGGYRYFRRDADDAEFDDSIVCSVDERIDLVEDTCKRVFWPLFALMLLLCALHLRSGAAGMWSVVFLAGALCAAAVLLYYYVKYRRLLKKLGIYY